MPPSWRTIVVMPAYNAANTLKRTYEDIPKEHVAEILVVDDCSQDDTVAIAQSLPVTLIRHEKNTGYGGNQKTCYDTARAHGADFVVMIHADYQYDARMIPTAIEILRHGICDVILGNRIRTRREALDGGMPKSKYFANRGLTILENMLSGQNLGEWHSGFRAYSRRVLDIVPYSRNSDNFVFDSQFLVQCVHFGFKLGDVPVPVRYFDEASSINFRNSSVYALKTLGTFGSWYLHRTGLSRNPLFEPVPTPDAGAGGGSRTPTGFPTGS
jgi:glycosyltransferase involved in cell wall biosynthesis